jgi:hypothetical protein
LLGPNVKEIFLLSPPKPPFFTVNSNLNIRRPFYYSILYMYTVYLGISAVYFLKGRLTITRKAAIFLPVSLHYNFKFVKKIYFKNILFCRSDNIVVRPCFRYLIPFSDQPICYQSWNSQSNPIDLKSNR